jgi:DNA polymerase (family 10)
VLVKGPTKASVILEGGLQADLRMVENDSFGSLLQYFTGSKQHNINLRQKEQKHGLKLNEYGITDTSKGRLEKFATEEEFYLRLGLQYIPPEIREGQQEIKLAAKDKIPRLVEWGDIKGDLHVHSDWSDGHDSIESIALAAKAIGYEYVAITDHSAGRGIAHGLAPEMLKQQIAEIRELNKKLTGIKILSGVEVDIKSDGSLDLSLELLAEIDVVVAAIHAGMSQSREKIMQRMLSALENPDVDIIAHPTCRLIGEREPINIDLDIIFRAAVKYNKAIEINAVPDRLDLKDIHAQQAQESGVKLVINTDAHSKEQLNYMRFGIGVARRGWCQTKHIINTRHTTEILDFLKRN